jgi:GNAT superfamily N-acetyltransferase
MVEKDQDGALREAARARGFRLVKSRRRKPGGDYGRFGLVGLDSGRECLGFGSDGLTATAEEVHAYLRGGEVASWKRSLIGVVAEGSEEAADVSGPSRAADTKKVARFKRSRATDETSPRPATAKTLKGEATKGASARTAKRSSVPSGMKEQGGDSPPAEPTPEPAVIREATRRDAAALARLTQIPTAALAERLAAAVAAGEPPLVAVRGVEPIGLAAWTIFTTLHQGPRGRITLLLVAEGERRRGVGSLLLEAVERHLAEAGVAAAELLLDVDFDAPTAFLRRTGWARITNGYGKELG